MSDTTPQAAMPVEWRWSAHPAIIFVARALGIDLLEDNPSIDGCYWVQFLDGVEWVVFAKKNATQADWMDYTIHLGDGPGPFLVAYSIDGLFFVTFDRMPAAESRQFDGRRLSDVIGVPCAESVHVVQAIEDDDEDDTTNIGFGQATYEPIRRVTAQLGRGAATHFTE